MCAITPARAQLWQISSTRGQAEDRNGAVAATDSEEAMSTQATVDLSIIENRAATVADMFFARVRATPHAEAFRFPDATGTWQSRTWTQTDDQVMKVAAGLIALGVVAEDRIAIASGTRYEWIVADLAIMLAGTATTTVYPSTGAEDVAYILADSGSRVVFAEDDTQLEKLRATRADLPEVTKVITFDGTPDDGDDPWVITLVDLEDLGTRYLSEHPDAVLDRAAVIEPSSLATLIYTSGTTGRPKGVRLRHDSWTYESAAIDALGILTIDDLQYLWLPLAHAFGKVLTAVQLQIGFATAVDGRVDRIVDNIAVVRPTWMAAVPRIFEKVHGRVVSTTANEGGVKAKLFDWAIGVGRERSALLRAGESVPITLQVQHELADRLVLTKIRDLFGGRIRFFISGSAALSQDVSEWFHAVGLTILEGLRAHRIRGGLHPEPAQPVPARQRRNRFARNGNQDCRGRRGADQGPRIDGGLSPSRAGNRRGADRGRLAGHRRHR